MAVHPEIRELEIILVFSFIRRHVKSQIYIFHGKLILKVHSERSGEGGGGGGSTRHILKPSTHVMSITTISYLKEKLIISKHFLKRFHKMTCVQKNLRFGHNIIKYIFTFYLNFNVII